jgi:hypothetical protein
MVTPNKGFSKENNSEEREIFHKICAMFGMGVVLAYS